MSFTRKLLGACVATLLTTCTAFAGDPGVSDDEILIGSYLPLQGPLSAGANQYKDGLDSYISWVNKNGGVNGRKIVINFENDNYNPQQAVSAAKKLVDRDGVFAIVSTLGTSNNLAVIPYLAERGVPLVGVLGSHPAINTPTERVVIPISPLGSTHGVSLAEYANKDLGAKRIAVFYQDDQYGENLLQGVKEYVAESDAEIVATASYLPSDVDFSAQVATLQAAKPDAVILVVVPKPGALFMREAKKVGWNTNFLSVHLMADQVSLDLGGDALDGLYVNLYAAHKSMDTEMVKTAVAAMAEFAPNTAPDYWAFIGMSGGVLFVEALRRIEGEPTREKLLDALETLGDFDPGVVPPVHLFPGRHAGPTKMGYGQVRNGELHVTKHWTE